MKLPKPRGIPRWSRVKKGLFQFLAPEVRGRFDLTYAVARGYPDYAGSVKLWIDGQVVLILRYEYIGAPDPDYKRNIYYDTDLCFLVEVYRSSGIDGILEHERPFVRAFGMLDRRVGKRRLLRMDVSTEVELVQRLYYLRCDAKGLHVNVPEQHKNLAAPLKAPIDARAQEMYRERRDRERVLAAQALERPTGRESMLSFLSRLRRGQVVQTDAEAPKRKIILAAIRETDDPDLLLDDFFFLQRESRLLEGESKIVRGVSEALLDRAGWIRPLRQWKANGYSERRQFSSLLRHLFAKYPVPAFMEKAWLEGNRVHEEWFKHIGRGQNIRTAKGLPVSFTKRQAHFFMQAPEGYTIPGAIRFGQVMAAGGSKELADAVNATFLGRVFGDNEFWLTVIAFLARHPMLDMSYVGPIIDYIWFQRYGRLDERAIGQRRGFQPNFSMRGRKLETLIRQVRHWHSTRWWWMGVGDYTWQGSGIDGYELRQTRQDGEEVIRIRELLSSAELVEESRVMRHCVATYDRSCFEGTRSIWTMEVEKGGTTDKVLTIAVSRSDKKITEVRGFANRLPTEKEMKVIRQWAARVGLEISSYIQVAESGPGQ